MKKLLVLTTILVMVPTMAALAADRPVPLADQIVVDRTTRDKTVNDYILLTRTAIQRAWTTPVELASPGAVKARIRINYAIKRSGALQSLKLVRGSGNTELDQTLLQAIRSAAPFPPFPDEIAAQSMLVRANFIVASVPTVAVTTVQHSVGREAAPEIVAPATPSDRTPDRKKLIWGVPAGTALNKESEDGVRGAPVPPPVRKYKWGR